MGLIGPNDLVVFVTFSGYEDDVPIFRILNDLLNCIATIDVDEDGFVDLLRQTAKNLVNDGLRIFGARIVTGDVEGVSDFLGSLGHARTLGAVTISAAAEENAEFAFC